MTKFVVTYTWILTNHNHNPQESLIVEAGSGADAIAVVRDHLRDLGPLATFVYSSKEYTPPPPGKILGRV